MRATNTVYPLLLSSCALLSYIPRISGFFLMPLGQISIEQKDPIVNPGEPKSEHVHVIAGSSCFSESSDFASLTAEGCCTSAAVPDDLSAYWAPMLYYEENGKVKAVSQAQVNVYYKFNQNTPGSKYQYQAFPDNFQMRAGSPKARSLDAIPQKVAKWKCLGSGDETPTFEMPNRPCPAGLRADISFPNCWNGGTPSATGKSDHMAYAVGFDELGDNDFEGACPSSHSTMLPRLFMEIWFTNMDRTWDPATERPFFLSQGDRTGLGLHADFMNGWKNNALESALSRCNGAGFGEIFSCFPKPVPEPPKCTKPMDASSLGVGMAIDALPGNLPITRRSKRSHSSKKLAKLLK